MIKSIILVAVYLCLYSCQAMKATNNSDIGGGEECPIFEPPFCPVGNLIISKNGDGCNIAKCQMDNGETACPEYAQPHCESGEKVVLVDDVDNSACKIPVCK
ncbi:MAG: hypothetical protein R3B45_13725 [Bdellovibrionota bacterium]